MSKIITNPKNYTGEELTNIFFRPMLSGATADKLGIRILYNLPTPTTIGFWGGSEDVLRNYSKGWQGGELSSKFQKRIELKKVKAEMSYAAADYFSMVYEKIACSTDTNMSDLTGTELERAETDIFKSSVTEGLRATMWIGNSTRANGFNTFDGFIKRLYDDKGAEAQDVKTVSMLSMAAEGSAEKLFKSMLEGANAKLRNLKSEGQLVIFTTGDVVENYENSLFSGNSDTAREARINGITNLTYRGIPVVDMGIDTYLNSINDLPRTTAILTDKRNLALAVNTRDLPGSEVSMWYNPDELENRQRALFLAGADYLLPELTVTSFSTLPTA